MAIEFPVTNAVHNILDIIMFRNRPCKSLVLIFLLGFIYSQKINAASTNSSMSATVASTIEGDVSVSEVDFGEEGDVIFRAYLRDILLVDGLYAIVRDNRVYLPIAELASLLDFPIFVDPVSGKANGWFLRPENTFGMDTATGQVNVAADSYVLNDTDVIADDIDLFATTSALEKWFPLTFDISLSAQVLTVRSPEVLPKEQARERLSRSVATETSYAATKEYDIPGYRFVDWPEVSLSVGSLYSPTPESTSIDYRVRAVGDFAFMNGKVGFGGNDNVISGATATLGRTNPQGMLGPLRIADFEVGDTSQFLPAMIGSSLSGRGIRFGNTNLADERDLDKIDLQGEQQSDYEVELYVNSRLRGVDRDSSDNTYDFQDVPLQLGQNEIVLEFYGPQGQRFTEKRRSFVGGGRGREGKLDYEFAVVEPGRRVFDLFDEFEAARDAGESPDIRLSSALNLTYGLSNRTGLGLTIASLSSDINDLDTPNNEPETLDDSNKVYTNARITTEIAGALLSGDITSDPDGNMAGEAALRTSLGKFELGISQQALQRDYRDIGALQVEDADGLMQHSTDARLAHQFFRVPGGRLSYGFNASYEKTHNAINSALLGARLDYQTRLLGLSWSHEVRRNSVAEENVASGSVSARAGLSDYTRWSLSSNFNYSSSGDRYFKSGTVRASRPLGSGGYVNLSAARDLVSTSNSYTAAWNKQFSPFRLSTSLAGTSSDDYSVRVGLDFTARRHPGRWLPSASATGGNAAVAVLVFGDDNNNGVHDDSEPVVQGVRLTRNGLLSEAMTDSNGIALLTGLSSRTSVDLGIIETDIKDPSLKYRGIEKGVLPRPGRVPVISVALQRATDLEGTVTLSGDIPAPNIRLILTPVEGQGETMEIRSEYDGYYYLAHVPLGVYDFGPDPEQLEVAGLVAQPATRRIVLENLQDYPPPEDFNLLRLSDLELTDTDSEPQLASAIAISETDESGALFAEDRSWVLAQDSSKYTIQIGSSVDRELLLSEAQSIESEEMLVLYDFKRTPSGRPVYGLAVGVFASVKEALRAIGNLPTEMKVNKPWVRQFGELQEQVEEY